MFGQYMIIEIVKKADISVGDTIVFSDTAVKIARINLDNFTGTNAEYVPNKFHCYYKVIEIGNRLKINNWRRRLI